MPKNKGADGRGDSKSIAEREKQSQDAKLRRKKVAAVEGGAVKSFADLTALPVEKVVVATATIDDMINGRVATGHVIGVGEGNLFEVTQKGLTLRAAEDQALTGYTTRGENIFLPLWSLTLDEFTSPLRNGAKNQFFADKQEAMWKHIASEMTDEQTRALKKRLDDEKESGKYVGEDREIFARANRNISDAFEALTLENCFVEFRIGNDLEKSIVVGVSVSNGALELRFGHVGGGHELAGKVIKGTVLWASGGLLPETLSEAQLNSVFGPSLTAMRSVLLNGTHREVVISGLLAAHQRLRKEGRANQKVASVLTLVPSKKVETPVAQTVAPTPAPKPVAQPAPVMTGTVSPEQDNITQLIKSLREAGMSPKDIGEAIAGYNTNKASSGSKSA